LQANSRVYVDVAGLICSYPIKEVNRYIERLGDGGFEDRVISEPTNSCLPKLMAYSISIIQNADYLTTQQKRDILYNNAARFLRIDTGQGKLSRIMLTESQVRQFAGDWLRAWIRMILTPSCPTMRRRSF